MQRKRIVGHRFCPFGDQGLDWYHFVLMFAYRHSHITPLFALSKRSSLSSVARVLRTFFFSLEQRALIVSQNNRVLTLSTLDLLLHPTMLVIFQSTTPMAISTHLFCRLLYVTFFRVFF